VIFKKERLVVLSDMPESDPGDPTPTLLVSEQGTVLAFGLSARQAEATGYASACVTFKSVRATLFGGPNDEALGGHRLAPLGLMPYAAYRVENSRWIDDYKSANRVHPRHNDRFFDQDQHFVMTFHDSMLEVMARSYEVSFMAGTVASIIIDASCRLVADIS
jgi:hypothetical protein